jgi:hypothetical protein
MRGRVSANTEVLKGSVSTNASTGLAYMPSSISSIAGSRLLGNCGSQTSANAVVYYNLVSEDVHRTRTIDKTPREHTNHYSG